MSRMQDFKLLLNRVAADPTQTLNLSFAGASSLPGTITYTRASTATFVGSNGLIQSAISGAPRFGYDPVTLAPLGLLIEETRTNVVLQSQTMANAAWAVIGAGAAKIGAAPVAAPDGTLSAYEVAMGTDGGAIGVAGAFYQILGAISAGQVWASSIYVMAKTGASSIRLSYFDGTATTGTVDTPISSTAWTRLVYVVTVNGTSAPNIALRNNVAGNSGNIYVWGGQCELTTPGYPGPTSYIPTTAATVTRAADVAVMTGTNFSSWYNQAAGSFVTQATPPGDYSQLATVLGADVAAVTNVHQLQKSDATGAAVGKRWSAGTITTSVAQALIAQGADGAAITAKLGYAFAANDFAFASGGSIVGTDAAGTVPTVSQLNIGQRDGASQWFNGHIGGIAYYNVRKTNAQLQAMTT